MATDTTQASISHNIPHDRIWAMSTGIAAAGIAAVGLVGCTFSVDSSPSDSSSVTSESATTDQPGSGSVNGGTYATELVGQTDFADETDSPSTGKQALQEVKGGKLELTNLGPGLAWQSSEAASSPGSSAVFVAGELEFTADQVAPDAPITTAGVGVGTASDEWDYFLACRTDGTVTLQRSGDNDAVKLAQYENVGCGQSFTLGLEAHSTGGAPTELLVTLPDGSQQTVADDADYGPYMYYGFMVDGEQYPARASALNGRAYVAPE